MLDHGFVRVSQGAEGPRYWDGSGWTAGLQLAEVYPSLRAYEKVHGSSLNALILYVEKDASRQWQGLRYL